MVERVDYYSDEEYEQARVAEEDSYIEFCREEAQEQYEEEMKIEAEIDAELDKQAGI